jgi:all-trans-retinol dehydrogenase (NAD+)
MSPLRSALQQTQNPVLTGPLFWALTKGPAALREPLLNLLGKALSPTNVGRFITALKWTFYIGIISKVNQALNDWATNNWQWKTEKDKWDFKREVAVVTGGCSGIGLEIVRGLMRKGVKVAVFDVQALPKEIENCRFPLSYD